MANILLDYLFKISTIEPTPAASTAFLKQVCVAALPKDGGVTAGTIVECSTMTQVNAVVGTSAAAEIQQLFNAGMSKVFILPCNDLYLTAFLEGHEADFYTVLIAGSDFAAAAVTATQATGIITVSSYSNLLTTTPDSVTIEGVVFTAQSTAVTPGDTTFRASTDNATTAASLAAQINAHPATAARVTATVLSAAVTLTAVAEGSLGNDIDVSYTDNGSGNIGITLSGLSGGKLSGGDGLYVGAFEGVVGVSSTDDSFLATQAAISNRSAWHTTSGNKGKNMFYAFGKLLSNALTWNNQQYISMPVADDVETAGDADDFYDDRISFVISDDEFSERLAFFVAGGKAIVAPYIERNLQIDLQSEALTYIAANQPSYTKTQAALLEDELQKVVQSYIDDKLIESGTVAISLEEDDFVADGEITFSQPRALWRIFGEMRAE